MEQGCPHCGSANGYDALFCAHCGHALTRSEPRSTSAAPKRKTHWWIWPLAGIITLAAVVGLYFWLFLADDMGETSPEASRTALGTTSQARSFYAMTDANIRDKPTTQGSTILGKLPRGAQVTGTVKASEGASTDWLELSDGKGFIAMVNLSPDAPAELLRRLNDQVWVADESQNIWSSPAPESVLLDRVPAGTRLTLSGVTAGDYLEVKLVAGGFGYIANAEDILAKLNAKPIAIGFNPQSCVFTGEIGAEFAKIAARLRAQWQELEAREFADDAARDNAYAESEGKSNYVRMRRAFDGLTLTAIGQHYESQSLYFADPPQKVIDAFRARGFNIGKDGLFRATELYAGITATRGEGAAYGKTELGCGV